MMKNLLYIVLSLQVAVSVASCGTTHKKKKYLKETYKEIKKTFPQAQVSIVQDSIKVIFPNNVVFDVASSHVKETFKTKLSHFARILKEYNRTNLLITGHTDNSGNESDNLKLSLDRANNVKDRLSKTGVPSRRLFTWGLGEKNPISPNDTEEGRARNRRVEFVVLYNPKP